MHSCADTHAPAHATYAHKRARACMNGACLCSAPSALTASAPAGSEDERPWEPPAAADGAAAGLAPHAYRIRVRTGDVFGGGCHADASLVLEGECGRTDAFALTASARQPAAARRPASVRGALVAQTADARVDAAASVLQRGSTDEFAFCVPSVGRLLRLELRLRAIRRSPAWFLHDISVASVSAHAGLADAATPALFVVGGWVESGLATPSRDPDELVLCIDARPPLHARPATSPPVGVTVPKRA